MKKVCYSQPYVEQGNSVSSQHAGYAWPKKIIFASVLAALPFWVAAQNSVKTEVKKDARKAEHKTEQVASKAKAKVTDKTYADKVGPDGQTIYIDRHSKYYWIDDRGHKKYVSKAMLKDKQ